jgi:hypothetical protein
MFLRIPVYPRLLGSRVVVQWWWRFELKSSARVDVVLRGRLESYKPRWSSQAGFNPLHCSLRPRVTVVSRPPPIPHLVPPRQVPSGLPRRFRTTSQGNARGYGRRPEGLFYRRQSNLLRRLAAQARGDAHPPSCCTPAGQAPGTWRCWSVGPGWWGFARRCSCGLRAAAARAARVAVESQWSRSGVAVESQWSRSGVAVSQQRCGVPGYSRFFRGGNCVAVGDSD